VILSMRSLMPIYNPRVILGAWSRIAENHPHAQLVVKHMGVVTEALGPIPFADRVHIVGHVPYARMAAYYQAADVAVSIASSDSAPRSAFEAMACGTPCVLSDLPWVHEVIRDGREAVVVPIDADRVAGAVSALLDAPDQRRRMAAAARALAERAHDSAAHMDRLAATYHEVIAA
jgi:glycosyltransferase involved in cell wall biosynthesis